MKADRESAGNFLIVFIPCLKYLMTRMITKRLKGYVQCLYTRIKYKSITVCIKDKTGGTPPTSWRQKRFFNLNFFPKQTKKDEIKEKVSKIFFPLG